MMHTIVVATDGSETADVAVAYAAGEAKDRGATLLACDVVDDAALLASCAPSLGPAASVGVVDEMETSASAILKRANVTATAAGASAEPTVLFGSPASAIVEFAIERDADAIVVGTRGKRGLERLFLGSTAAGVLRRSPIPVWVVPPNDRQDRARTGRILVALDGSEAARAALDVAIESARTHRGTLVLCAVAATADLFDKATTYGYDPVSILDELRREARRIVEAAMADVTSRGATAESLVCEGTVVPELLAASTARDVDLIVVGKHAGHGLQHMLLGTVAERIAREAFVPVAVVGPPKRRA